MVGHVCMELQKKQKPFGRHTTIPSSKGKRTGRSYLNTKGMVGLLDSSTP